MSRTVKAFVDANVLVATWTLELEGLRANMLDRFVDFVEQALG